MMRQQKHTTSHSQGYALLLAILIANIILAMSLGIFSIALKEATLTTYLKNSQSAFGAADHVLECALYWDMASTPAQNGMPYTIFATSTAYVTIPSAQLDTAVCDGIRLDNAAASPAGQDWKVTTAANIGITTFSLRLLDGTCGDATVVKDPSGTTVTANGYNDCNVNNPRRTQRSVEVSTNL